MFISLQSMDVSILYKAYVLFFFVCEYFDKTGSMYVNLRCMWFDRSVTIAMCGQV